MFKTPDNIIIRPSSNIIVTRKHPSVDSYMNYNSKFRFTWTPRSYLQVTVRNLTARVVKLRTRSTLDLFCSTINITLHCDTRGIHCDTGGIHCDTGGIHCDTRDTHGIPDTWFLEY